MPGSRLATMYCVANGTWTIVQTIAAPTATAALRARTTLGSRSIGRNRQQRAQNTTIRGSTV
ncbi:hypothetical protein GCM10025867_37460 [Frondihabitans sucicola]|uniref:Uncharacterized protein n=1 Tax=Frondihabitans sucicola TaxID=1268041 RepID=A0ABN6Y2E4_9MICO|nr:hypothetical protein [Frondihabitans sucicola]BDZ51505.1 hypothetical protein GCM10025867_37460 [Frondihabitans sucicola]